MTLIPHICGKRSLQMPIGGCPIMRFVGVEDEVVNQGSVISLTDGVYAYDGNGNEIEYTVTPTYVDTSVLGEYVVEYVARGWSGDKITIPCLKPKLYTSCNYSVLRANRTITVIQERAVVCSAQTCYVKTACS